MRPPSQEERTLPRGWKRFRVRVGGMESLRPTSEPATRHSLGGPPPLVRRGWILAIMCAGMFLVLLDVTIVNVALPAISTGVGADLSQLQWTVTAYTITFAAVLLSGGTLGDIHGHRRMVLIGLLVFGVASIGCGLATNVSVLIAARAVQGIGAALLLPATLAVIVRTFPGRDEQAKALGVWAGISSLALPAGPLLGGLLVTVAGWQAVFWINLPVAAIALVLTLRMIPADHGTVGRRIDAAGMLCGGLALAATVFTVITAGGQGITPLTMGAAGVGVVSVVGFVVIERRVDDPVLPLHLLRSRRFVGANVVSGAMNFVGIGTIFVLTLYLQDVRRFSPIVGGVALLPLFLPLAVLSPVTGRLTARFGPQLPMTCGLLIGAVGSLGLLGVTSASGYWRLLPVLVGLGVGMGLLTAAVVSAAMRAVPPADAGLGGSVNNTARQAAGALGIAVYGAVTGSPTRPDAFVAGLHILGAVGAATWVVAVIVTVVALRPGRRWGGAGFGLPGPSDRESRPSVYRECRNGRCNSSNTSRFCTLD